MDQPLARLQVGPRPALPVRAAEAFDRVAMRKRIGDLVDALQQHLAQGLRCRKGETPTVRGRQDLRLQIHADVSCPVGRIDLRDDVQQVFDRQLDGNDAVAVAVVEKDPAERGRDHRANAELAQCLGRPLARRAAAEIAVGQQDPRVVVGRLIEDEFRVGLPVGIKAPKDRNFNAIVAVIRPYPSASIVDTAPKTPDKPLKPRPGMPVVCACGHLGGGSLPLGWPQTRLAPDEPVLSSFALPRNALIELVVRYRVRYGLRAWIALGRFAALHLPQRRPTGRHQARR